MFRGPRTRRGVALVILVAAIASAAVLSVSTATAAPPAPVTISAAVQQGFSGVWQGSGAIADSGSFARTDVNLTGSFFRSPAVGAFQAGFTFIGSRGTFTLRDEVVASADGVNGNWQIASGTGAYDGMSGHGTSSFDFATGTITFSGVISKAE